MVRIIPGDVVSADFSRGWLAPTAQQPKFASFYQGRFAGSNLVSGGDAADVVGAVNLVAAVAGTSPAYAQTTGGSAWLQTHCPETASGTIISIARMPTIPTQGTSASSGTLVSNFATGNTMLVLSATDTSGGSLHARAPADTGPGWSLQPPVYADMAMWGLYAYRYVTSPSTVMDLYAPTKSAKSSLTAAHVTALSNAPLVIGSDPYAVANAVRRAAVQHAFTGIWDYALTDAEMTDVFTMLRAVMAQYGTTV